MVGTLVGLIILIFLRALYFSSADLRPNMAPQIAFFFIPILWPILLVVAFCLEAVLRRFGFRSLSKGQAFVAGILHTSILSWWVVPNHWYIVVAVNPIVLGFAFRKRNSFVG